MIITKPCKYKKKTFHIIIFKNSSIPRLNVPLLKESSKSLHVQAKLIEAHFPLRLKKHCHAVIIY